jgi:hypothetical protein
MPDESPLALLPVEIVRDILEIAARSDIATAATLEHVSQTVRRWIGPILYQTVLLRTPDSFISFVEMLRSVPAVATGITRDMAFYRQSIQQMAIGRSIRLPPNYMEPLVPICGDVKTLELERCFILGPELKLQPRQLITSSLSKMFSKSWLLSRVTHLWLNSPQPLASFPCPETLICLAIPLRVAEQNQVAFQEILALPNLKLFVINLMPRAHALSTRIDNTPELSPSEVWNSIWKERCDSRIVIRQSDEEAWVSCRSEESPWRRAIREGLRHPNFHDSPPIDIPEL